MAEAVQGQAQAAAAPAASDPISKISAILAAETAPPPQQDSPPTEQIEEPTGEPQVEGDDAPSEAPEQTADAQEASSTPADEQATETSAKAEIPLDQLDAVEIEVTVKGEDGKNIVEKPTVKELREGYMRQKDYQRKTAEVARQREEVSEKVRQGIESQQTQYVQTLAALQATLIESVAPELRNVDWNTLAATDAFEYVRLKNRADQITAANNAIQRKIQEVNDQQTAAQRAETQKRAAKAREMLESDIPGWNDDLYQTLIRSSVDYGFKPEEVATWVDARSIKVLHDAYQYRQSKVEKKPVPVVKKVTIPPKVLKPGGAPVQTAAKQKSEEAMKRLNKSGRIEDAAALIASRMR